MDPSMRIKIWGAQGSIPTPLTSDEVRTKLKAFSRELYEQKDILQAPSHMAFSNKVDALLDRLPLSITGTYGGDTTSFEVQCRNSPIQIVDMGTGIRRLGMEMMGRLFGKGDPTLGNFNPLFELGESPDYSKDISVFLTHFHWDHLQGFPFFEPAFVKHSNITFFGKRNQGGRLEDVLKGQQEFPNFPVTLEDMPCNLNYEEIGRFDGRVIERGNSKVKFAELDHPDSVFGYRFEVDGCSFVVATDTEHRNLPDPALLGLAENVDVLYYDAQYLPEEYPGLKGSVAGALSKFRWGHSTYEFGVLTALEAGVKTLVLGHHEPKRDDFGLENMQNNARAFKDQMISEKYRGKELEVEVAYSGWTKELNGK